MNTTNITNATTNGSSTPGTAPAATNALLLAGLCAGFAVPILLIILVAHKLVLKRSRYALWWDPARRCACSGPGGWARLYEHVRRCGLCFPERASPGGAGAEGAGAGDGGGEGAGAPPAPAASSALSFLCCCDRRPFEARGRLQTCWMYGAVALLLVSVPLLIVALGGVVAVLIQPLTIGIGVGLLNLAALCGLYVSASYYHNGYRLTPFARGVLFAACLLLCVYAFAAALLVDPLSFTGVSAVALAFQMFFTVPALYLVAGTALHHRAGSGKRTGGAGKGGGGDHPALLSFQEWVARVGSFSEEELEMRAQAMHSADDGAAIVDEVRAMGSWELG